MDQQHSEIKTPHDHDVLSGRGNFVNYHVGNEHFRNLVRRHKLDYVQCPKPQKGKYSRMIYDEIRNRNPPGRFLKQDPTTKLWYDIGEKKALDKTRQALREGAPVIIKGISGENEEDTLSNQQDGCKKNSSGQPSAVGSDMSASNFMQSPAAVSRNGLLTSPHFSSPGNLLSPGMLLGSFSPEPTHIPDQLESVRSGRMMDASAIPGPPLQFDGTNQLNQRQSTVMMNAQVNNQLNNNFGGMGNINGMLTQEQINFQNQIKANQAQMNFLQQQLHQQQQQMNMNSMDFNRLQMMSKLNNLNNQNNQMASLHNNMGNMSMLHNANVGQFEPKPIEQMPPPPPVQSNSTPKFRNLSKKIDQEEVNIHPGNNPRRMPPPSLLKREDSMKMEKVFSANSPSTNKKKVDGNSSSNHLSAMSLSIADMQDEGNLSAVFDSSLRIGNEKQVSMGKLKQKQTSEQNSDAFNLEMSVNTIGTGAGMSATNDMSYATFGDNNLQESDGNMSLGKVFEDPTD